MKPRPTVIFAVVAVLLLAVAAGAYAYDQGGRNTVPRGVTIGGVDVGGLNAQQAKARLERDYLARLRKPVRLRYRNRTFVLGPRASHVAANLHAMVQDALAEAHSGNMFTRSARRLTGGSVNVSLRPEATYSEAAAQRLVDHIRSVVDRDPLDANASFASLQPQIQAGHDGVRVDAHVLLRRIAHAVVSPGARHAMPVPTRHTKPAVGTAEVRKEYGTALVVDRARYELHLYKDLKLVKTYRVAIGMIGLDTPAGLYHIQNKAVNPAWTEPNSSWVAPADRGRVVPGGTAENPLKARWLGIFNGAGIHGVDPSEYGTIGHQASHGCVRMTIPDVVDLYQQVPVGAPIYIA